METNPESRGPHRVIVMPIFHGALAMWDLKSLNWYIAPRSWENAALFRQMRKFGVNGVRRHFVSDPVLARNADYFNRMRMNAQHCMDQGMVYVIDMYAKVINAGSGGTAAMLWQWQMPEAQFLEMWAILYNELKAFPNAVFELGNEPNDQNNTAPEHKDIWLQRCIKAIKLLRSLGYEGYIVIPLPEVATDGKTALKYRDQVLAADPLKRFIWDFHYYWYWQEAQAGTPNDTSEAAIRAWLQGKGIAQLRALGDRVLCGEFGTHTQNPDARDVTHFTNLLHVLKADDYDYCGQSFLGGGDFPMLTGAATAQWTQLNATGVYFVSQIDPNLEYYGNGGSGTNGGNGEMSYINDATKPVTRSIEAPDDYAKAQQATLFVTAFDVDPEDGATFTFNESTSIPLPPTGNTQQKTLPISIPVASLQKMNTISFTVADGRGFRLDRLELELVMEPPEPLPPDLEERVTNLETQLVHLDDTLLRVIKDLEALQDWRKRVAEVSS
jgi:hypothetical protein